MNSTNPAPLSAAGRKASPAIPPGGPRASRNKATLLAEHLLGGEAEGIARAAMVKALGGNASVLRSCLARLVPPAKHAPIAFDLPETATADDIVAAYDATLRALADGEIAPEDALKVG